MNLLKGLNLFKNAYKTTKHQIWVSILLLMIVTLIFSILMYAAECGVNRDFDYWDALVWTFVKYVEDPADITTSPITVCGQIVGTMVGVLGIAIFAVPAGLIGSGLMNAMDEEKHERELDQHHLRMHKAFRRESNKSLRTYLNTLPDKGGKALEKLNFVPQFIPVSRLQIRQGIELNEVFGVCEKYPEYRIKNLGEAVVDEQFPEDRFVVSMFPKNRSYGCCIDRNSKVTIVCPTGYSETGTGWFSYYLAKLGGFNYVCKDIEVDPDELDSFYNMSDEPLYDKKTRAEYSSKQKDILKILRKKEQYRKDFLGDIKRLNRGADSWVVLIAAQLKNSENLVDVHFAKSKKDGSCGTVNDIERYDRFYTRFAEELERDLGLKSIDNSNRYPFNEQNLAYRLLGREGMNCNVFALRPSTQMMIFDVKKILYAYRMACVLSEELDNGKGIHSDDVNDFQTTGFGFAENRVGVNRGTHTPIFSLGNALE